MPLDVFETDPVEVARIGVGGAAPRYVDARGLRIDSMVNVLQRDDPLRRLYLKRRWQGHPTLAPLLQEPGCRNLERMSLPPIALSRR